MLSIQLFFAKAGMFLFFKWNMRRKYRFRTFFKLSRLFFTWLVQWIQLKWRFEFCQNFYRVHVKNPSRDFWTVGKSAYFKMYRKYIRGLLARSVKHYLLHTECTCERQHLGISVLQNYKNGLKVLKTEIKIPLFSYSIKYGV